MLNSFDILQSVHMFLSYTSSTVLRADLNLNTSYVKSFTTLRCVVAYQSGGAAETLGTKGVFSTKINALMIALLCHCGSA